MKKTPLAVGACVGTGTSGKCSSCLGSVRLRLARVEWRSLWLAQKIKSSILCPGYMDQPSQEGDAALYTGAARSNSGASWALPLPCDKATQPADPRAGLSLCSPGRCGRRLRERTVRGQSLTQVALRTPVFRAYESVKRTSPGNS